MSQGKVTEYVAMWIAFLAICSATYLYGQFSVFRINIFPYLSVTDIALFSIFPLLHLLIYLIPIFFSCFILYLMGFTLNQLQPKLILILILVLIYMVLGLIFEKIIFSITFPVILILFYIYNKWLGSSKITEKNFSLLLILILAMSISYESAKVKSDMIFNNEYFSYICNSNNGVCEKLKFVGYVNDKFFFVSMDNKVLTILENPSKLILYPFTL